jgi:DNA modification methylase
MTDSAVAEMVEVPCVTHGDCIEGMAGLPAGSVDAVVTSPPYAMQRKNQYGGVAEAEYPDWSVRWMRALRPALAESGSVLINIREHIRNGEMSDYVHRTRMALRDDGWFEWDELVWVKTTSAPIGHPSRPRRAWERVLWFGKSRQGYADPKANGKRSELVGRTGGTKYQNATTTTGQAKVGTARCSDVVTTSPSRTGIHPAAFPTDLAAWMVGLASPRGGTVLDPFAGSGTTALACVNRGRKFVGFEINKEYAMIANARIQAHMAKGAGKA